MSKGSFEAKKHAYRQTQDGIVVSFVIHPNDLDGAFAIAPLGTRYMVGFAEIGDDGKPVKQKSAPEVHKERKPFSSFAFSQQAAIRCADIDFLAFLGCASSERAAEIVRSHCRVDSRSEIIEGDKSGDYWLDMESRYQAWITDQRYAGLRR